ncbi:MAG TPA: histidine kinase dimerization/phosphoacceptor domain -containing protein [Duganella sp.]|nr:histidine kinase dimerization/phosphoacceptor domain -containing protein [Duganella sp.]
MLPVLAATAVMVVDLNHRETTLIGQRRIETARALMQAVDRELSHARGTLQTLAASPVLTNGDLRAFYSHAVAIRALYPQSNFVLSDNQGQQILNTLRPFGASLPRHGNPAQLHAVFAGAQPVISDLYLGGVTHQPVIGIDVPVMRNGKVVYDLSMGLLPAQFLEILGRQRIEAVSVAAIFDSRGVIVARTWEQDRFVGHYGAPSLIRRMREVAEDSIEIRTLEGIPVVSAFSRSSISGWCVAIGVPTAVLARERHAAFTRLLAMAAFSLLAGLALAAIVAEGIARPIRALGPHAQALGAGKAVAPQELRLKEADEVAAEMRAASQLLLRRTVERDRAERAERDLRALQDQLLMSEAFQRRLFDESPDAVLLVGADGRIMRASIVAEQVFGYASEQLVGLGVESLMPEELASGHVAHRAVYAGASLARSMGKGLHLLARRANGDTFPVEVALSPLGEAAGGMVLATVRDISQARLDQAKIQAALGEKETLLKELYHRVKNNLQVIASMIGMQARACTDPMARRALEEASGRVRAMSLVHEKLYQSGDLSSIELDGYVAELCTRLGETADAGARGIVLECQVEPIKVGLDMAVPLGLVLNELVTNCLKHAFPGGRGGRIVVELARAGERMRLSVRDNGIGMPTQHIGTKAPTLGLRLIAALSAQLDGEFSLESHDGTTASLVLPWPEAGAADQSRRKGT